MTPDRRRLVALAAALVPARAAALIARLGDEDAGATAALATGLAGAPRRTRLAALAASLPSETGLRGGAAHPLLERLAAEAAAAGGAGSVMALTPTPNLTSTPAAASLGAPGSAERTLVREAAGGARPATTDRP